MIISTCFVTIWKERDKDNQDFDQLIGSGRVYVEEGAVGSDKSKDKRSKKWAKFFV